MEKKGKKKEYTQHKPTSEKVDLLREMTEKVPGIGEFDYFNLFPDFQGVAEKITQSSLEIVQKALDYYHPRNTASLKENTLLRDKKQFGVIESLCDSMFEKLAESIDMERGLLKDFNDSGKKQNDLDRGKAFEENVIKYDATIEKPQLHFKDGVDNSMNPFVCKLRFKHNAKVEQEQEHGMKESGNPYLYELATIQYPSWELEPPGESNGESQGESNSPRSEEETPLVLVTTEASMQELVEALKQERSFAVDLEHHSYRSYQGFTCLIQISTRQKDYIVDAIVAREFVWMLNDPFSDSTILKVFHGSMMDIQWLQKDFGVYVVNLFDTGQAARALHFESFKLSYLLERFCGVKANKAYQLADWRIRPLTAAMLKYAREDTHYLLYISDVLRGLCFQEGADTMLAVLKSSNDICKQAYRKPEARVDEEYFLRKHLNLNYYQKNVYMLLYYWRDLLARRYDESPAFLLSDQCLSDLSYKMPERALDVVNYLKSNISYRRNHIRNYAGDIVSIIAMGKAKREGDSEEELQRKIGELVERKSEEETKEAKTMQEEESFPQEEEEEESSRVDTLQELIRSGIETSKAGMRNIRIDEVTSEAKEDQIQLDLNERGGEELSRRNDKEARAQRRREVDADLDLEDTLRGLALQNGEMSDEESETNETNETNGTDGAQSQDGQAAAPVRSLREEYRLAEVDSLPSALETLRGEEEMIGARKIDTKNNDTMKKSIGWKEKSEKVALEKISPEAMKTVISSIHADNYMMTEDDATRMKERMNKKEKKEPRKEQKHNRKDYKKERTRG